MICLRHRFCNTAGASARGERPAAAARVQGCRVRGRWVHGARSDTCSACRPAITCRGSCRPDRAATRHLFA